MKHLMLISIILLATGCSLDLEEVRTREAACKAENGQIKRVMQNDVVMSIRCVVDGVEYWVAPSGKLK
jgi:hypothetical protein